MIEISHRSALFLPKGAREDWCGARFGWYRLVGLTFRHAANNANWAAVCSGWEGSLLEENTIEWANGTGINLQGQNNVIRGNRANDNGMRGIGGRCQKCRIEYNETSRNNWKGYSISYGAAGIKLIYSNENLIRHHLSSGNYATGLWLDVHNRDNTIENCLIINNLARGILLEFDTIRTLVINNVIVGTDLAGHEGSGLQAQAASHNTIAHNTIISNKGFGIWIRMDRRAEDGYNRIYNNLLIANAAGDAKGHSEIRIDVASPGHPQTNVLDGNLYWRHGASSNTFVFRNVDGVAYRGSDLIEWQRVTGSDSNASILDPTRPHVEDAQSTDGWRLVPLSQAMNRGVQLPKDVRLPIDIHHFLRPCAKADVGAHQRTDVSRSANADNN
jgi:parallel beta-helix repeat protein